KDIGLTAYTFGLGAGMFFIGYFFLEVPSNLLLQRFGARRWIARIMASWGVLAIAMMFVTGPLSFLVMRFLIGAAEAGFFPGVILYLTYWFSPAYRARIIGTFMVAIPMSLALGAPISTAILGLDRIWGLAGWQWLYLLEGAPTVIMGVVVWFVLPDRPRDAKWLTPAERSWLQKTIDAEQHSVQAAHGMSVLRVFADWRVLGLSFVYFANTTANLGLAFFLPQILKGMGLTTMQVGLYTAIPYVVGTIGILVWGYVSDRMNERRINLAVAMLVIGIGLVGAGMLGNSLVSILFFSTAAIGIYGAKAPFWPLPSMFLSGSAAAVGIALINSIGNLGGFAGPYIVGWVKDSTGSFESGLYALSAFGFVAAIAILLVVRPEQHRRRQAIPCRAASRE
ncbi:MAG TPA: MFS transporter, partial [Stellaceae bacterium]|nr:MFS transporter [Stellaceae bacterium]